MKKSKLVKGYNIKSKLSKSLNSSKNKDYDFSSLKQMKTKKKK
jgi:hypothetical protein